LWSVLSLKHGNLHLDKSDVMCGKLGNEWCDVAFILKRIYFDGSSSLKQVVQFNRYEIRRLDGRSPQQHSDNSNVHFSRGQGRGAFCPGTFFSQASENQQFDCVFVVSNSGYKAAAWRVKFVTLFSVRIKATAEIVNRDHLKYSSLKQS
jgi:hypothetical protein